MAILDVVEGGQTRVSELRSELDRVRGALDRTDAVLGATDEALGKAETAIEAGRRWAPRILVAGVVLAAVGTVAVVGGVAFVVVRRRRSRASEDA